MNGAGSQGDWLRIPECLRATVALLVGGLGPVMAVLGADVCPLVGEIALEARSSLVVGGVMVMDILGFVAAHWWMELGPGSLATGPWKSWV